MLPKQTPYKPPVVLAAALVVKGAELDGHTRYFVVFGQGEKDHPPRGRGGGGVNSGVIVPSRGR